MARARRIRLEIYESGCGKHPVGQKIKYPEDAGKLCRWLLDSATSMIRVLECGGTLTWEYKGTPYEKLIENDGVTTEFIRCPDPTSSGVVLKVTARHIKKKN
ncbi:MAG: hypothetical protein ACFE7R_10570 [Candidatus Hodarchaeota archaeon]